MQKMDKKPLISILMNCFNGELYLEEALNSIIAQSYTNWELIFWDNRSTDNSNQIVTNYKDKRIKIFKSTKHSNLGKARKDALKKCKGEYLTFLDVDDLWHKDKLTNQIKVFENKEVGISFTNTIFFSSNRKEILYKNKVNFGLDTSALITNYYLSLESIMINMNKLKLLEYTFDDDYNHISDFDLIIRLSSVSKVQYLNEILSFWRIHLNNESFKRKELFNKEKIKWCDYHLRNKYLKKYIKSIKELKSLILAQKRIESLRFYFISILRFDIKTIYNCQNKFFILYSYLPLIPKIIYEIKNLLFNLKWARK